MARRSLKFAFLGVLILAVLASGCSGNAQTPPGPVVKIRLPMGYIPNVQFAPFYVAKEKGYFAQAGLEIDFDYKFETDGVALVGANEIPFAIVSGEQVLLARKQGLPVVYALGWWQAYPVALVAKTSEGIKAPADLKGKKIGLPGPFGANYIGLRALLMAGGLKESEVTLDSIGFTQVEALAAGRNPVVVGYINNEPIQLKGRGFDVTSLPVKDYMQLASNGLLTSEKVIANQPDLVQHMVDAILKGLKDTLANPDEAYEISKKYVEGLDKADPAIQKQVLLTSIELWKAAKPGYSEPKAWENMQKVLLDMGLLTAPLELEKAYTNRFIR
jgi:NitT/TauT family transport system substrate-binding protein